MTAPDIFTNVHKGIRHALFEATTLLGRAGDDPARGELARRSLRAALRFVAHHGDNEDELLLPLLVGRAEHAHARMEAGHAQVNDALRRLTAELDTLPLSALYGRVAAFTALYLEHMREEEEELEPELRGALSVDELVLFGRRAVERTAPADQRMMLGFMLPAMTPSDAETFLARLPAPLAAELRPLVG